MMKVDDSILRMVLDIFSEIATGVCQGQQIDMNFESVDEVSIAEYLEMIRLKTAVLLAGSLQIGALVGKSKQEDAEALYKFGENLGLAFQLQDDILDIYGDPDKFGKQVGGDIIANKKTFLLIKALEIAEDLDSEELQYWITIENADTNLKVNAITNLYNRLGVRQLAEHQMNIYAQKALTALNKVDVEEEKKMELRQFAEQLLIREN